MGRRALSSLRWAFDRAAQPALTRSAFPTFEVDARIRRRANRPVVVLGAGLTGMSAALELTRQGVDHWLVEKHSRSVVGDHALGIRLSFDRTGHLLICELKRKSTSFRCSMSTAFDRSSQLRLFGRRIHSLPVTSRTLKAFRQQPRTLCPRLHTRTPQAPSDLPNNFEEYCRAHFWQTASPNAYDPYNRRLWASNPVKSHLLCNDSSQSDAKTSDPDRRLALHDIHWYPGCHR